MPEGCHLLLPVKFEPQTVLSPRDRMFLTYPVVCILRLLWDTLVKALLESGWMAPVVSPLPQSQSLPLAVSIKQNVPMVNWHWLVAPRHLVFLVPGTPSIMAYSVTFLGTEAGLSSLQFPRSSILPFWRWQCYLPFSTQKGFPDLYDLSKMPAALQWH